MTENPARTKRKTYRVADNYLAFWLGHVERYRSQVERGLGGPVAELLESGLADVMGAPWEDAFRRHLVREAAAGRLPARIVELGRWWNDNSSVEIDVVGLSGRAHTPVLFGEAKWACTANARALVQTLAAKAAAVPGAAQGRTYAVCAREELLDLPADALAVTAADIFGT